MSFFLLQHLLQRLLGIPTTANVSIVLASVVLECYFLQKKYPFIQRDTKVALLKCAIGACSTLAYYKFSFEQNC